jgi:FkbM family methyltransferase
MKNRFSELILPWLDASENDCIGDPDLSGGCYVYGAGDLGVLALDYCEACDIEIRGFLDRARNGSVVSHSGRAYPIYQPNCVNALIDKSVPVIVAIATSPFAPIAEQLHALHWKSVTPFYNLTRLPRMGHPLANGWRLGKLSQKEKDMVRYVCDHWSDETSWLHYEAFLAWHRDNTEIELNHALINPSERYALPELQLALKHRQKIFVDVGSHHGESIARMNSVGLVFREYHSYEPDPISSSILQQKREGLIPRDAIFRMHSDVLSEEIGHSNFQAGLGYCSQLWKNGAELRRTNILDTFDLSPDFLKIHTEGSEIRVIKGALETIDRSKPVIAYSVYHRREGFYSDIAEAMSLIVGYRWLFRLHSFQGTGGFVYAIPN